jgi:hypothetical protein
MPEGYNVPRARVRQKASRGRDIWCLDRDMIGRQTGASQRGGEGTHENLPAKTVSVGGALGVVCPRRLVPRSPAGTPGLRKEKGRVLDRSSRSLGGRGTMLVVTRPPGRASRGGRVVRSRRRRRQRAPRSSYDALQGAAEGVDRFGWAVRQVPSCLDGRPARRARTPR